MPPVYVQERLGNHAPYGVSASETLRFNISLGVEDGRILLSMEDASDPTRDYIVIRRDAVVEIVLEGDQLYFSKMYDGITTKEELAYFYGGLEYDGYIKELDRYKIARFTARYNQGGKYDTIHPFNVNVDFLQTTSEDGPKWIGLTIDPDIKNPPPGGG